MIRSAATLFLTAFLTLTLAAPASAQDTKTFDVSDFTGFSMSVLGTAYVTQGDTYGLRVEGPQAVLDRIRTEVDGNTLVVEYESESWYDRFFGDDDDGEVDVYVTFPTIESLAIAGAAALEGETPITSDGLTLAISGAGKIDLDVDASTLSTAISGAGQASLRGTTGRHDLKISGAGSVEADELESKRLDVNISGTGSCEVHVTDVMEVNISGMGSVKYLGSPRISQNVSGMASVKQM